MRYKCFGQVWENSGKNPSHPHKDSAMTFFVLGFRNENFQKCFSYWDTLILKFSRNSSKKFFSYVVLHQAALLSLEYNIFFQNCVTGMFCMNTNPCT